MIGEFKIQLKDLMSKYGSIQEHEIIYYMGPAKKRVVAGILQLLPVFVDDFKKADEEYDQSRTEAQVAEFNRNARLQETYIKQ